MITQIVKDKLFYDKLFYSEKSIGIICCNHNEYLQLCELFCHSGKTWCNGESYVENDLYQQLGLDNNDVVILGNDGQYVLEKDLNAEGEDILTYYDVCITFANIDSLITTMITIVEDKKNH